jgi:glutathione reductase (NADPH)
LARTDGLKRTFTEPVPENREQGFKKAGITTFHGQAHFVDHTTLTIGDTVLTGRHVLIASGAMPITLGIPDEAYLTNSTEFLSLEQLPSRIVFVGGGYISFEFAHIATRAGSQVTILHRGSRPLEHFDVDLVASLVEATRQEGIEVQLNTEVTAVESRENHLFVHMDTDSGPQVVEADLVVHGAGRAPDLDGLALDKAGVSTTTAVCSSMSIYKASRTRPSMQRVMQLIVAHRSPRLPAVKAALSPAISSKGTTSRQTLGPCPVSCLRFHL